jgi:hypothetical protein
LRVCGDDGPLGRHVETADSFCQPGGRLRLPDRFGPFKDGGGNRTEEFPEFGVNHTRYIGSFSHTAT